MIGGSGISRDRMIRRLSFTLLVLLWAQLFLALIPSWQAGTYYSYGWLVPAAMVLLFLRRRADSPIQPDEESASLPKVAGWHGVPEFSAWACLTLVVAAILLLRIVEGGNVHWRLPIWAHGGFVVAGSLAILWLSEGRRVMKHFAPVFLFAAVAIPLPSFLETALVDGLTDAVVETGADLSRLLGMPVEVTGRAFLIDGQPVDVNDGCSGIRSFQSSLMAGLFVGELLRLGWPARLTLLMISVGAAFLANAVRVVVLIDAFLQSGYKGIDARHDTAGNVALIITYGLIVGFGFLLDRWMPEKEDYPTGSSEAGAVDQQPSPSAS